MHDSDGRLWLQYWFFYYLNDLYFLGNGTHEGDWEDVQIRMNPSLDAPDLVVFGAHNTEQQRCEWSAVEKEQLTGYIPYVYVANASHGNYPHAGNNDRGALPDDQHWGDGRTVRPALEVVRETYPGWFAWPGRWGGTLTGVAQSPPAPREQEPDWTGPNSYADSAHACDALPSPTATLQSASETSHAPSAPEIAATKVGDRVRVDYRIRGSDPRRRIRRPAVLLLTLHSSTAPELPVRARVSIRHRIGRRWLKVSTHGDRFIVRGSVFSPGGVRSRVVATWTE